MRVRTRKNLKKKNGAVTFLFLLPLIGVSLYAGGLLYIINDMASYTFNCVPDTDSFYDLEDIDFDILEQIANALDARNVLYHMPTNLSVSCEFTDYDYDNVSKYHETDNAALWGGQMLGAQCFRYATAKEVDDAAEMSAAMVTIRRLTTGFYYLMAVPNGGVGPEYSGTPARFYAAPGQQEMWPEMFSDHYKMFNGTGDYKNWRCRLYTSKDELAGYLFALGSVLKFVDPDDSKDAEWCVDTVKLITAQLIEGFKKTNWLVLHGDGNPAGSDNNANIGGAAWKLAWLRLGATAYPELYENDYQYIAAKGLQMNSASEGSLWNTIMEYYAYNFGQCVVFTLVMLEDNPKIRNYYISLYEESFYEVLRYHRNAWMNVAHLAFMSMLDKNERKKFEDDRYSHDDIRWDVHDQLWRYYDWVNPEGMQFLSQDLWGERNYNLTQRPHSTRETSRNEEIRDMKVDPTAKKWRDFFDHNVFGKLYAWASEDLFDFNDRYVLPITVSEHGTASCIWARNPFYEEVGGDPDGNGLMEERGLSFLLPYWIGRYYGFVDGPSS